MNSASALARDFGELLIERGLKKLEGSDRQYPTSYLDSLFDWELYFDGLALAYYGVEEPTKNGIRMFLDSQREDGFICRRIHFSVPIGKIQELEAEEHCKPFLCQLALTLSRLDGKAWLEPEDLDRLAAYLDYWVTVCDRDGNGLSEWNSGPHAGADTQHERIGVWRSRFCEGVDLNCYLYREFLAAAELATALGRHDTALRFRSAAKVKRDKIQELWDRDAGFFFDRDCRTGKQIRVMSAAPFLTLWAGIATPQQAQVLVEKHLKNDKEFWTPCPVPSYARCEPSYTQHYVPPAGTAPAQYLAEGHANWCGGMWTHWNYLIIHGLSDYGYQETAQEIAARWFHAASSDQGLYEWYNAETGQGEGVNPFWAGSSVLGVFVQAELGLGISPMRVEPVSRPLALAPVQERLALGLDR